MSTIDIVYGIGIAAFIIIAIVAFTALSREKGDQNDDQIKDEQKETDVDFLDSERPFVSKSSS